MADKYDFAIDTLKFRLALDNTYYSSTNQGRRYVRSTAQFRKEQFDAAAVVGDQSLAGWWTRGQLSFHEGAGTKYYEVLDGKDVLNTFQDSSLIYPWTPGEVSLSHRGNLISQTGVTDCVGANDPGGSTVDGVVALVSGNLVFIGGGVANAPISSSDGSAIKSLASDGKGGVYYATSGAIEGPASVDSTSQNFWQNPRFYAAGTPISGKLGSPTFTYNNGSVDINTSSTSDVARFDLAGMTPGKTYRIILDVASCPATFSATDGTTSIADGVSIGAGLTVIDWTPNQTNPQIQLHFTGTLGHYVINEFSVTDDPYSVHPNPHDDASWSWEGVADASMSSRQLVAGQYYPLWRPPKTRSWASIWFAKGRLFAIDTDGRWYQLPPTGGSATDSDVFWSSNLGPTGWSLTESPGAVYIAKGGNIYALYPDSTGGIPTLSTPSVAGSLPIGEETKLIYSYLGSLVIATNMSLRTAAIDASTGGITYSPQVVDGDFSNCIRVSGYRNLVYATGKDADGQDSVFTLNMVTRKPDGLIPYARFRSISPGPYGVTVSPGGVITTWASDGISPDDPGSFESSGWILTGFHRLGTLEPKAFEYIRVKTEGSVGSISVSVRLPGGTEASVGSVSAGSSADLSLRAAVPTPVEYVGIKFTLTGSGAGGPTLLGYQIKALPVPQRQRMIQVPLDIRDTVRLRGGTIAGREGKAWSDLQALEALESSKAIVPFTDYRTGETGQAYIDGIEFNGDLPANHQSDGFGGIAYVSLRVVS